MSSSDRENPITNGHSMLPPDSELTVRQYNLMHRISRARADEETQNKRASAATSNDPKEAMTPAAFIKGSQSFGVDFKAYLKVRGGRVQAAKDAHAAQRRKSYQALELKHWYKCILSEIEVDSERALDLDPELVKELLVRTAQVFAPIIKHRFGKADTAVHDALLARLDGLLVKHVTRARHDMDASGSSGVWEFISSVPFRYESIQGLFEDLRQSFPGYDPTHETYLYLAWLALACTAGNVKALSDMANFFYAHCHVVNNTALNLSGYGKCFELAHNIKPEGPVKKNAIPNNQLADKARDRARYLLGKATACLFINSADMQDSDMLCYEFVLHLAYMLDGINVFDELALDVRDNSDKHPGLEVPGGTNGGVKVRGELVYLLNTKNREILAEEATVALNRFMRHFSGTFVGLGFEGVVNAYYEHLTSSTSRLPSTILIETAMLSVIARQKIAKRVAIEQPGKAVEVAADDLLDEYTNTLSEVDSETLKKLIYIYKTQQHTLEAFDMRANNELTKEGGATNCQQVAFTSALSVVVKDHFVGANNSGLKDFIASLAAEADKDSMVQEAQLFQLSVLYDYYKRPIQKGDGALASVMLGLSRERIKSIALEFSVAVDSRNWLEFIAATVAAVNQHFVADAAVVVSEEVAQGLRDYIVNLQGEYAVVNAIANVMGGIDISTIVAVAERLPRSLPAVAEMDLESDFKAMQEYTLAWKQFSAALDQCCIDVNGSTPIRNEGVKSGARISQASTVQGVNAHLPIRSETASVADEQRDFFDSESSRFISGDIYSDTALVDELCDGIRDTFSARISGGASQQFMTPAFAAQAAEVRGSRWWGGFSFGGKTTRLTAESVTETGKKPSTLSTMWEAVAGGKGAAKSAPSVGSDIA